MPQAYFTFAKQIFHIEDISLIPQGMNFIEKDLMLLHQVFFWWERVDSNDRKYDISCLIYSFML